MSIIKKLGEARKMLAARPMKKSGLNKFAGFQYFELADFLPHIIDIFAELEIVDSILITNKNAVIKIGDADNNSIDFSCAVPESIPVLKGQNELQAVGSMQTYLRRYLYVTALAISENDVIDQADQNEQEKSKAKPSLGLAKIKILDDLLVKTDTDLLAMEAALGFKAVDNMDRAIGALEAKLSKMNEAKK